jgi:hypothetical protein
LGERLLCKQEVIGSIPFTSTRPPPQATSPGPPRPGGQPGCGAQGGPRHAAGFGEARFRSGDGSATGDRWVVRGERRDRVLIDG